VQPGARSAPNRPPGTFAGAAPPRAAAAPRGMDPRAAAGAALGPWHPRQARGRPPPAAAPARRRRPPERPLQNVPLPAPRPGARAARRARLVTPAPPRNTGPPPRPGAADALCHAAPYVRRAARRGPSGPRLLNFLIPTLTSATLGSPTNLLLALLPRPESLLPLSLQQQRTSAAWPSLAKPRCSTLSHPLSCPAPARVPLHRQAALVHCAAGARRPRPGAPCSPARRRRGTPGDPRRPAPAAPLPRAAPRVCVCVARPAR
jgi:hypothetical protein